MDDGRILTTTLVLSRKEIHRVALSKMLETLEIDLATFERNL